MERLEKILCVDDEPNILAAFRRQLKGRYELEILHSPEQALDQLKNGVRYAVIVSDMRMPGMDGAALLRAFREGSPDTVRIMLTGNMDQDTAAQAVNEGKIFRFLTKPCSTDDLASVIDEGLDHHRLLTAEKDLLQNTLSGSVKVLTDILSLTDPVAFGLGAKLRQPIKTICTELKLSNSWEIELAAMLSVIGWITVPEKVKERHRDGRILTEKEEALVASVTVTSANLIRPIPRLAGVSNIILQSAKNFDGTGFPKDGISREQIPLGSRIIKIAQGLLELEQEGSSRETRLKKLLAQPAIFDATTVKRLLDSEAASQTAPNAQPASFAISARELCVGHRLMQDLVCADGRLLLTAGTYISDLLRTSILNYAEAPGLKLPILVDARIPLAHSAGGGR